ncbi:hypothetical protein ABCS02_21675 [Microbacterium sp. X-17]|uniref:hypothetical protein n=1 Tax=Microbacterium sp. X-17 TaxID=3144404 RepID=UPI0031F5C060
MVSRRLKITIVVTSAAAAVALAALAVPAVMAVTGSVSAAAATVTPQPTASVGLGIPAAAAGAPTQTIDGYTFSAVGPGECKTNASLSTPWHENGDAPVELLGELTDMGATRYASGPVGHDAAGRIQTYTVQAGDTPKGIGERFCIDEVTVEVYNHRWPPGKTIQPGDILVLRPDPTVPWSKDGGQPTPQ